MTASDRGHIFLFSIECPLLADSGRENCAAIFWLLASKVWPLWSDFDLIHGGRCISHKVKGAKHLLIFKVSSPERRIVPLRLALPRDALAAGRLALRRPAILLVV
jgi:hypothetical protein